MSSLTWLVLACLAAHSAAYPELFVTNDHANGCTSHPTGPLGDHGEPVQDKTTTFKLSQRGSTKPETAVCPGIAYDLVVDYGSSRRRTLISASAGKFSDPGSLPADPACPNRAASSKSAQAYTNTLTLPCDTKVSKLQLEVTSAGQSTDNFHAASTTLAVNPVSQCPGSTCPGAPPAAAAAAAPPAEDSANKAQPATQPAAATAQRAAAAPPSKSGAGGCSPSAYQYACSIPAQDGAILHYTLNDQPTPPDNACTASSSSSGSGSSGASGQQQYLHMLLESPAQGYSGVGFPQQYGKMYPADAVIGYVDDASGQPVVSAYHLTNFFPSPSPTNNNGLGWASHMGAARPPPGSSSSSGVRSLLCFSRAVDAPGAAVLKQLNPAALTLNWVGDSSTSFSRQHELTNSLEVNVADGSLSRSSGGAGSSKLAKQLAHGALMLLAFVVFMPLGALMARHKWLMGDSTKGGLRPGWFHLHRSIQSLSVLLALTGFILALASFSVPWTHMSPSTTPHTLYNPHRVLGVIAMALSLLQVVGGLMRPGLSHKRRPNWRKGHTLMGWLAVASGVVVVLMGAVMMRDMVGVPLVNWLLPILLLLGLLVAAGVVAEVKKTKLERQGRYDPSTHTFAPTGSGTGTPDAEISSRPSQSLSIQHKSDPMAL